MADRIQIPFPDKHSGVFIHIEQAVQVEINFSQNYADLKRRFTQKINR
jgi:hypothetical protein